jgi:DNA repair exonuclease SbcCD ATPase subunit
MDDPATLRSVTIENFRGFRAEQTIDLAASATIVSGSNGKGKTSFFDALQWLLLGSLARLANLASRRSDDYIVNRFSAPGAIATVRAELLIGDRVVVLTRAGDQRKAPLTWTEGNDTLTGEEAEQSLRQSLLDDPEMSLKDTVLTSGLLQQDVVRAVLEDEPKNRYKHMAAFLGLREIAGFEDEVKREADDQGRNAKRVRDEHAGAEQRLRSAESELARLQQRLVSQPEIDEARFGLEAEFADNDASFELSSSPTNSGEAVALGQLADGVRRAADNLLTRNLTLRKQEAEFQGPDPELLAELRRREEAVVGDLAGAGVVLKHARTQLREAEKRANQVTELATRAIPLLGERCPVCRQPIKATDVEAHLREVIGEGEEDLLSLIRAADEAQERHASLKAALEVSQAQRAEGEAAVNREQELAVARVTWRDDCHRLASSTVTLRPSVREAIQAGDIEALTQAQNAADHLGALAERLAALLGASGLGEEVERQRDHVQTLRGTVEGLGQQAASASRLAEEAKTLSGAASRAIAGVTRDRFASLQPLVDDIFARLAPHPAFTSLGFEMTVSYRRGVADAFVKDPESGVTGDPLLVFSSSQANVAALTYFLALSWSGGTKALPFLLLDDPLQSMDDVNALGFSDLCRHIRSRRQLIVSTHEDRLASLLERKLMPRSSRARTRVVRFTGWDRSGPTIEQDDIDREPVGYVLEAA